MPRWPAFSLPLRPCQEKRASRAIMNGGSLLRTGIEADQEGRWERKRGKKGGWRSSHVDRTTTTTFYPPRASLLRAQRSGSRSGRLHNATRRAAVSEHLRSRSARALRQPATQIKGGCERERRESWFRSRQQTRLAELVDRPAKLAAKANQRWP